MNAEDKEDLPMCIKRRLSTLVALMLLLSHTTASALFFSPSVETWSFSCYVLSTPEVGDQQAEGEPASYVRFSTAAAVVAENKVAVATYDGLHVWEIPESNLRASSPWDFEVYNDNKYRSLFSDPDVEEYDWDETDDYDDEYNDEDDYDDDTYVSGDDSNDADEEIETVYESYDPIASFIMRERSIVCMVHNGTDGWTLLFYGYGDDEIQNEIVLSVPDEEEDDAVPQVPLLLDTGLLLYADGFGTLYTCEMDGSAIQAIPNVSAAEFVYHDGYVYFANLADRVTYIAYSDPDDEYFPIECPRLYRVRLDGSDIEKLSEGGVRGLCSQGRYICYQSLEDQYEEGKNNEYPLLGTVHCYNAEKEESRSLGIGNAFFNACIPTPYGVAIWDSVYSPYDIDYQAKLNLYDFDGNLLRPLRADPLLLWTYNTQVVWINDHLDKNAVCFHYYSEYPGEEGHHLFIIPLNGDEARLS